MSKMEPATLRRYTERGAYDIESARAVFDDCFIAHVAYVDDGLPACQPMLTLIREEEEEEEQKAAEDKVEVPVDEAAEANGTASGDDERGKTTTYAYLHGHPTTRLMELVKKASKAAEAAEEAASTNSHAAALVQPVKVCITATKIDGLVLSSAPNGHSFNYRSAMLHGTCEPVRDKATKAGIMRAVTNKIVANRFDEVNPISSLVVNMVYVVRVRIDRLSVKTRTGVPGIQPRHPDVDGPNVEPPAWAGVVPLWEQLGDPVDSGLTPGAAVSDSLRAYIAERNAKHEAYAKSVAK